MNSSSSLRSRGVPDALASAAQFLGIAVLALGVLVLTGWVLGIEALKSLLPELVTMKFNTALAFTLAGAALCWREKRAAALTLGGLVALLGALTLGEHFSGLDFGIDPLFIREADTGKKAVLYPGRMSPVVAVCFFLSGTALALLGARHTPWRTAATEMLAVTIGVLGAASLLGYVFETEALYSVPGFSSIALHTAAGFLMLAAGLLCAVPQGVLALAAGARSAGWALWVGFGVLTTLLLTLGVISASRLHTISTQVIATAEIARPRSTAVRELVSDVAGYAVEVRAALSGNAEAATHTVAEVKGVARHLADYERLARTPQQRELAGRFAAQWRELHTHGEKLLATGAATRAELDRLANLRRPLEQFLNDEMQLEAVAALDAASADTVSNLHTTEALTLLLLIGGIVIALVTSGAVARAVLGSQAALRASEARLRIAAQAGHVGIWEWNVETDELIWDDAMFALYGVRREDFTGAYDAWAKRLHPEDLAATQASQREALAGGKEYVPEFRVVWPDGTVHHLQSHARVITDPAGTPVRMIGTNVDITERRCRERNLAFLADLQTAFSPLTAAEDLKRVASERIATHLGLRHCALAEIDEAAETCTVICDHRPAGEPNLEGVYRLGDFLAEEERRRLASGETLVIGNVRTAARSAEQASQFKALGIGALVNAPYLANGRWKFMLSALSAQPQAWPAEDVELLTELVARIYLRIERARAEEKLGESEARLRLFIAHAPAAIAMLDHEMRYLAASRQWLDDYAITGDFIGRSHYAVHPDLPERWKAAHRRGLAGETLHSEGDRHERPDGSVQWAKWEVLPWRTAAGEIGGILIAAEDITARKETEDALHASEERFRSTFENAAVGVAHVAPDGRWLRVNDRLCDIVGYPREELLTKTFADITHPDDLDADWKQARRVLAGEIATYAIDKRYRRKDDSTVWIALTVSLVRQRDGAPDYFISIMEDITARKRAEAELLAAAEVAMASKHKSEFLANMSHELRTPLNSILIFSQQLAKNKAGNLTAKQIEFSQHIHASGIDLLHLINDILDLSKIESGTVSVDIGEISISGLRDNLERNFRHVAEAKNLPFHVHFAEGLPKQMESDPKRLQQILKNLLSNAVKFTAHGKVEVRVDVATRGWSPDHPVLSKSPQVVAFAVEDTGIGIATDKQRLIFEAFQQADAGTARNYGGTGLGLAISRELAALLGGEIRLSSALGQGSTFTLYVPLHYAGTAKAKPPQPARIPAADSAPAAQREEVLMPGATKGSDESLRGCKVLVVDDDPRNIFALTSLLEDHGADILTATNGRQAIELVQHTPGLRLVLMDIMMPEMESYETMREIRHDPKFRTLPILALTAKAMKGDREKCLDAGASDYMSKPVNTDQLLSLMRVWLFR